MVILHHLNGPVTTFLASGLYSLMAFWFPVPTFAADNLRIIALFSFRFYTTFQIFCNCGCRCTYCPTPEGDIKPIRYEEKLSFQWLEKNSGIFPLPGKLRAAHSHQQTWIAVCRCTQGYMQKNSGVYPSTAAHSHLGLWAASWRHLGFLV